VGCRGWCKHAEKPLLGQSKNRGVRVSGMRRLSASTPTIDPCPPGIYSERSRDPPASFLLGPVAEAARDVRAAHGLPFLMRNSETASTGRPRLFVVVGPV